MSTKLLRMGILLFFPPLPPTYVTLSPFFVYTIMFKNLFGIWVHPCPFYCTWMNDATFGIVFLIGRCGVYGPWTLISVCACIPSRFSSRATCLLCCWRASSSQARRSRRWHSWWWISSSRWRISSSRTSWTLRSCSLQASLSLAYGVRYGVLICSLDYSGKFICKSVWAFRQFHCMHESFIASWTPPRHQYRTAVPWGTRNLHHLPVSLSMIVITFLLYLYCQQS